MSELDISGYRLAVKDSILHYLTDDWDNGKKGRGHKSNVALFSYEDGYCHWIDIDLEMVMEKVVKGIWSVDVQKYIDNTEGSDELSVSN